jgi:flagellar protein FliO/FliZ
MQILPALIRTSAAALSGCLLAPAAALAADGEQTPLRLEGSSEKAAEAVGSSGGGLVRTIVGLAVVIGVIYGLTWVLKQVKASKQDTTAGSGLASVATLPLGTNRSLHLVRAGDEVVLVGAGEHGVTHIRTYTEAEARRLGLLDGALEEDVFGAGGRRGLIDRLRDRTVLR